MVEVCSKCGNPLAGSNCSVCGLPPDLCVCGVIELEAQKIRVWVEKRKFNKPITVIDGITDNAKGIASKLKSRLACGGTLKKGHIELMGDHRGRIGDLLLDLGYSAQQIDIE
jgi:translation initiation factor 1